MKIHLKFFASLREKLDVSEEIITLPEHIRTAYQVRDLLITRGENWAQAFQTTATLRIAYQQQLLSQDVLLEDGGELAFFPAVTGG